MVTSTALSLVGKADPPVSPSLLEGDIEVWAPCPDHPGNLISSHGRLWSLSHRRLRASKNREGWYKRVIVPGGKQRFLHRLVALAFVPGHFDGAVVNHKDGNKANNAWFNLEWVTHRENNAHARRTGLNPQKLSDEEVAQVLRLAATTKRSFKSIAAEFNVSSVYVAQLVDGEYRGGGVSTSHRPRRGKLSKDEAREVVALLAEGELSYADIASRFSISESNVANIAAGRVWKSLTSGLNLTKGRRHRGWELRRQT